MSRRNYGRKPSRFPMNSEELTRQAVKRQPPGAAFGNPPPTRQPVRAGGEPTIVNPYLRRIETPGQ